jgi:Family of unknown function (DUF6445)
MKVRPFLHDKCQMRVDRVGAQGLPVIVIDNFLLDAEQLVEYAATGASFGPATAMYPGVQAPVPAPYPLFAHFFTRRIIPEVFDLGDSDVIDCRCTFSMVTARPDQVGVRQRVPHTDFLDPNVIVILHYLFTNPHGGTSFYRHRRTGYETMSRDRLASYESALKQELAGAPPVDYIAGDTPLYQRIASYDAVFNRAIIYKSTSLHAATIGRDFTYDGHPRTGRLTANTTLYYGDANAFFGAPPLTRSSAP